MAEVRGDLTVKVVKGINLQVIIIVVCVSAVAPFAFLARGFCQNTTLALPRVLRPFLFRVPQDYFRFVRASHTIKKPNRMHGECPRPQSKCHVMGSLGYRLSCLTSEQCGLRDLQPFHLGEAEVFPGELDYLRQGMCPAYLPVVRGGVTHA